MNNGSGEQIFDLDNLPPGYRFHPTDEELMIFLRKKVLHQPLPPNKIIELPNLYAYHPDELAERYESPGTIQWFYFTNINNPNGEGGVLRVRGSGEYYDGYWKQIGEEEEIETWHEEGRKMIIIGYKRAFVFYQYLPESSSNDPDKGRDGVETDWMMYECRLNNAVPELQPSPPPPPPPPKTHRLQILHTFILSPFLPARKRIIGGYHRKRGLPNHHHHPPARPSLKTNRILQEISRVNAIPPPIPRANHHNVGLDECCTVVCRIFKSSSDSEGFTSSSSSSSLMSSPTNTDDDESSSSPPPGGSISSNIIQQLLELQLDELHTSDITDQTNDDDEDLLNTASDQMECSVKTVFTDHAHNPFVNIPHTLQNQQQQQQQQPINVHHEAPHTNHHEADDASTSTSTSTIPKLDDHTTPDDDHTPHQDI